MNKRQMKKNRQLRLENERLREAQQVRLETEFALQSTNERMDDLHAEVCNLRRAEMENMRTLNQVVDQQEYLNKRYKHWEAEAQEIRASHIGINRRISGLEKVDKISQLSAIVAGIVLIMLIIGELV